MKPFLGLFGVFGVLPVLFAFSGCSSSNEPPKSGPIYNPAPTGPTVTPIVDADPLPEPDPSPTPAPSQSLFEMEITGPAQILAEQCEGPFQVSALDTHHEPARLDAEFPVSVSIVHPYAQELPTEMFASSDCSPESKITDLKMGAKKPLASFYIRETEATPFRIEISATGGWSAKKDVQSFPNCKIDQAAFSWMDDFKGKGKSAARARSITARSDGSLFVVGGIFDRGSNQVRALTRRLEFKVTTTSASFEGGWQSVDSAPEAEGFGSESTAIIEAPSGAMTVLGIAKDSRSATAWRGTLRTLEIPTAGEPTWAFSTMGFPFAMGDSSFDSTRATAVAFDQTGKIFFRTQSHQNVGIQMGSKDLLHWQSHTSHTGSSSPSPVPTLGDGSLSMSVRGNLWVIGSEGRILRSFNRGYLWDDLGNDLQGFSPAAIQENSKGQVYVAGTLRNAAGKAIWLVRRSLDLGKNWEIVDRFESDQDTSAVALAFDKKGGTYVTGNASVSSKNGALIRYSASGDAKSWKTIQSLAIEKDCPMYPRGLGTDGRGNVYWVGSGVKKKTEHWLVGALLCK